MKATRLVITLSAAASLLNAPVLWAQDAVPEPGDSAREQKVVRAVQDEVARAKLEAQEAQEAQAQAQKAQAEAQDNLVLSKLKAKRAQEDMAQSSAVLSGRGYASDKAGAAPMFQQRLQNIIKRGPDQRAGRTLVVRSSDADLKELPKLEEDMAVMSHILEKAASERAGGPGGMGWGGTAMGIGLLYAPTASPLRSLYLEGYGALFLLNVGFPLLPPPHAEAEQGKTETSSDWEAAKEELYGQGGSGRVTAVPSEPYDKERVSRLRDGLLEALKNAANIRDLKPDDSIMVCVFGGPSSGQAKPNQTYGRRGGGSGGGQYETAVGRYEEFVAGWGGTPMRQTIMTIRVKKSDVDAFAKGATTLEAFRKRAHIVVYAGSPEAGMSFGGAESGGMMGGMGGFGGGIGGGGGGFGGGGMMKP